MIDIRYYAVTACILIFIIQKSNQIKKFIDKSLQTRRNENKYSRYLQLWLHDTKNVKLLGSHKANRAKC